jgi:hypothetical protein
VPRRYWSCRKCKHRNERTSSRRCQGCGELTKPKPRVPKHAATLRDDSYETYVELNALIHGVTDESCAVCRRPRHEAMRHHRDHDHVTGNPRGLACFQCNSLMPRLLTLERAELIVAYLRRVDTHYATHPMEEAA